MTPKDTPQDRPATGRFRKKKHHKKKPAKTPAKRTLAKPEHEKSSSGKAGPAGPSAADTRPGCVIIGKQGSCPEWEELLQQYPMIDSVQREDFPDQGASVVYLAHFYRTGDNEAERSRAGKEFRHFFRAIGYRYDNSGDFESRWFEGVGVLIR